MAYFKAIVLYNNGDEAALSFYNSFKSKFQEVDLRTVEFLNGFDVNLLNESIFYIMNAGLRKDLIDVSSNGLYKIDVNACMS